MREKLLSDGVTTAVKDFEAADLCVINTCSVTQEADKDALKLLRFDAGLSASQADGCPPLGSEITIADAQLAGGE